MMTRILAAATLALMASAAALAASARGDGGRYRPDLLRVLSKIGVVPGAEVRDDGHVYRVEAIGMTCPKDGECTVYVTLKFVR